MRIGTAGWSIPRAVAEAFPAEGSGLERYAAVFDAVEINSTFYRPHRASTFERWAATTPAGFRFAVKVPKAITHDARLEKPSAALHAFLDQVAPLGDKLGPVLVQLPPSLVYERRTLESFLRALRKRHDGEAVFEPRHPSWFTGEADAQLAGASVARVAADPAKVPAAAEPGGAPDLAYWRWHGSPRLYWSAYGDARLRPLAERLGEGKRTWVIFDNTASGAAADDALKLRKMLQRPPR